ncbi:DUF2786 domain-containing protein [Candidatus Frankia alpina]|uniref:DUF2786 domain-containing protein n=1 Tax=Candidatus Frankia alpina TaxID=2699483 RepID=UPI001F3AFE78|nr:DUF2786 domain-containing protein [Candidatus Frankia alpina]
MNRGRAQAAGPAEGLFYQERSQRELLAEAADLLVAAALNAKLAEDDEALAEYVESLVAAPGGPSGRRAVNRCLVGWFDRVVGAAWQHGWQPVDVHRVVNRRAGQRLARLAVDAIALQMRQYAAATVDERWRAQLEALDVTVWWDRDDTWLDAWGDRAGRDRAEVLVDTLDLLILLNTLPRLESLCPPPGAARRDTSGHGHGHARGARGGQPAGSTSDRSADPRMLDKVRALLAKAESTGFAEEAEALTAKAQELMARHSIDEALLAAGKGSRDSPAGRRVGIDNPYEVAKASLLDVVADANRCRSVWSKNLGFATVVGFEPDLDAAELLYTSLLVQATTAMMRAGSRQDRAGRSRTRSFRQSFLASFAVRIGQRLMAATEQVSEQAAAEAGDGRLLPVLAARTDSVREATETMFPEIVSHTVSATDGEGWASGRAAADLASLHTRDEVTADRPG